MSTGTIVTVNVGSSSIKLVAFSNADSLIPILTVSITDINQPFSSISISTPEETNSKELPISDMTAAVHEIVEILASYIPQETIVAFGHRLVHGGTIHAQPVSVQAISSLEWDTLAKLDAHHTLQARQVISQLEKLYASTPHIACFDTAFFNNLPMEAQRLAIPKKYFELGARRYGFHGLSYTSILEVFRERAGEIAANGRVVMAHLGSGASLAATIKSQPIDTTMSLTPSSGIPMSTRSGDIDPHLHAFLQRQDGIREEDFEHMTSFESGLLGMSGVSGDMHTLLELESKNDDVALAVQIFINSVRKSIAALSASASGIDSLIFSGGMGEQSAPIRKRICDGLQYLGIEVDSEANNQHSFLISSSHSRVGVHVIPANEALIIAKQTLAILPHLPQEKQ